VADDVASAVALADAGTVSDIARPCGAVPASTGTTLAILIAGSLYLCGEALRLNEEIPQ
jgi:folylpolyglutamate synthase/dihydropteroate synthase